jgi:hypothetical protein
MDLIAIRVPKRLIEVLDAMARERLDNPDRSGLIRELLAEAIAAC